MIKEIKRNSNIPNWNEVITLELTLRDLQIIFDAVGDMPPNVLEEKHKHSSLHDIIFEDKMSSSKLIDKVYDELESILVKHNGVLDLI